MMPQVYFLPTPNQTGALQAGAAAGNALGRALFNTPQEQEEQARLAERRARVESIAANTEARVEQNRQSEAARLAALDVVRKRLMRSAQGDPTLRGAMGDVFKQGMAMDPEQRLPFWESKAPGLIELETQGRREALADQLLEGLSAGQFGTPNWEMIGGTDPATGKPAEDPSVRAVQDMIQGLRDGTRDPAQVQAGVDAMRKERAQALSRLHERESLLNRGRSVLDGMAKGGFAALHPTYGTVSLATAAFESGSIGAEKYLDIITEAQTGRKSGASPRDPDVIWDQTVDAVAKRLDAAGVGPEDPNYKDQIRSTAEALYAVKMGGPKALATTTGVEWSALPKAKQDAFVHQFVGRMLNAPKMGKTTAEDFKAIGREFGIDIDALPRDVQERIQNEWERRRKGSPPKQGAGLSSKFEGGRPLTVEDAGDWAGVMEAAKAAGQAREDRLTGKVSPKQNGSGTKPTMVADVVVEYGKKLSSPANSDKLGAVKRFVEAATAFEASGGRLDKKTLRASMDAILGALDYEAEVDRLIAEFAPMPTTGS